MKRSHKQKEWEWRVRHTFQNRRTWKSCMTYIRNFCDRMDRKIAARKQKGTP